MPHTRPGDPDGRVFDDIYAELRDRDPGAVPWVHGKPHPMFTPWLETAQSPEPSNRRALVIGSGLGDDAIALADHGWEVTAFDVSPHAVAWARERFPDAKVHWHVADLFALPETWRRAFDLVLEIHTIQALPVTRRQSTIGAITDTIADGGELIVVAMTREAGTPLRGRPWPLTPAELDSIQRYGVVETDRHTEPPATSGGPGRVRITYRHTIHS